MDLSSPSETPSKQQRDPSFIKGMLMPWIVCLLAALFYSYDFLLRVTPSVMIHPLMQQYNVGAGEIGLLSAFYYYAYTPLQIPSGMVIDKYSIRWVLTLSILTCILGAVIFAAFPVLYVAFIGRILMGIGSAFAFVGALKLAALWLPRNQFALFSGIATALGTVGAILADNILSRLVHLYGWRGAVLITAALGIALAIFMDFLIRDRPPWVKKPPKSYYTWKNIWGHLGHLLKNWRFWMVGAVGCFLFLPINVFASLWGVAFLTKSHHLSAPDAASTTSLIFIGTAVGSPIAGWFSDYIKNRRLPLLIGGFVTLALTATLIYWTTIPTKLLFPVLFLIGFFCSPQVLVFAIAREISPPRTTGMSSAATNFLVTIGAAIFQPLIGYLLDMHWTGLMTDKGIRIYSLHTYKMAFLVLPAALLVSFLLTFLIPKTRCVPLHSQEAQS